MKGLHNLSSDFLLSLVTEKNMSLNTASSYKADLKIFFTFIEEQSLNFKTIKKDELGSFFRKQRERGFSDNTVSRRLSTIKQFFKFLVHEGLIDRNPCEEIKNFKKTKKIPGFLSEKEVLSILNSASRVGKNDVEKARNKALIEILYASGMRVSELVSLRKSLFIGTPEMILIKGKGNKERMVPISKIALSAVKKYLKTYNEISSTRGLRYFGPSKMSFYKLLLHSFAIISVFKYQVFLRSAFFIIIIYFLDFDLNSINLSTQILTVLFCSIIFLISFRENEIELLNSHKNLKNIKKI